MKDFDTVELRAARTMPEADYFFKQHKEAAARYEFAEGFAKRIKATISRAVFREGRLCS